LIPPTPPADEGANAFWQVQINDQGDEIALSTSGIVRSPALAESAISSEYGPTPT
jgi:hypothetical protein